MDNRNDDQELNLDDILSEFQDNGEDTSFSLEDLGDALREEPAAPQEPEADDLGDLSALIGEEPENSEDLGDFSALIGEEPEAPEEEEELGDLDDLMEVLEPTVCPDTGRMRALKLEKEEKAEEKEEIPLEDLLAEFSDTRSLGEVSELEQTGEEITEEELEADTIRLDEPVAQEPAAQERPILQNPRAKLHELKKKLVAGPEKRYYALSEVGLGGLQVGILLMLILVLGCGAIITASALGWIPENRLRLVIFSQVLALLISGLLCCNQMLDGLSELLHGRFTINTMLTITFIVCCVDAVFCLSDLRIPCCAAFALQGLMALWSRYQRRSRELAQMDTLRKAVRLNGLFKVPSFYDDLPGYCKAEGQLEDFMDNYDRPSTPEKIQSVYCFLALLLCIGIAVLAGLTNGASMAFQILSTSLLVAVPASFFVALTRPAAVLEQRLHMVGAVICGWKGVKGLCGKAAFPLEDTDIFPTGSTKLNGVKFYGSRKSDEVIAYTTSLIAASESGLTPVFRKLLEGRGGKEYPVENFRDYGNGGIGGEVNGEPVLLGELDFLQSMGVDIPEGTMVTQAIYTAIDGQLCAVFALTYAKMRSASAGLVTLCGCRKLTPVFVGGDFMLTPGLLRAKFNIRSKRLAFPAGEERRWMAHCHPNPEDMALALITREDLVSYAYAVSGARSLRTASTLGLVIHLLGGILGMVMMLVLAIVGAEQLLTPAHVLLYQLVWLVPGLLFTAWVRTV